MENIKVHDLARFLGVSTQTIHMYEKYKIIQSSRNETNNYRIYDREAINLLLRSRILQKLGFSMSEIADLFHQYDAAEVIESYANQIEEINQKIHQLNEQKKLLEHISELSKTCLLHQNEIFLTHSPELYLLPVYQDEQEFLNQHLISKVLWDELSVYRRDCSIIRKEEMQLTQMKYEIAMGFDPQAIPFVPQLKPLLRHYPSRPALVYYTKRENQNDIPLQTSLQELLDYTRQKNYVPAGDAIINPCLFLKRQTEKICYLIIYLPVDGLS